MLAYMMRSWAFRWAAGCWTVGFPAYWEDAGKPHPARGTGDLGPTPPRATKDSEDSQRSGHWGRHPERRTLELDPEGQRVRGSNHILIVPAEVSKIAPFPWCVTPPALYSTWKFPVSSLGFWVSDSFGGSAPSRAEVAMGCSGSCGALSAARFAGLPPCLFRYGLP